MKIELWNIERIIPYEKNPRKNEHAVEAVARSIKEFGFRVPIVVDANGIIIAGHTRLKASLRLGLTKVPVHVAKDLPHDKVLALRIADNRTHELSEWDLDLLTGELQGLRDAGFDLSVLGWADTDLSVLLAGGQGTVGLTDPDDVPAPPDEAVTKPGDLIILGSHRLLCGDSGSVDDLDRLLDGKPIHLCNTDPPYNVKVEPRSNNAIAAGLSSFQATNAKPQKHHQEMDLSRHPEKAKPTGRKLRAKDRPLANDFVSDEAFDAMLDAWFGNIARVLIPGGGFYCWGGYANVANYPPVFKKHGLYFSQAVIWDKMHPVLTRKDFMGAHEWCFYGWKEGAAHRFFGPANVPDLWHIKKVNPQSMVHLTEKPTELAKRAIEYSSQPGEHVLDLFGGSGSTLIACEQTGRRAFLMELDPLYCDVIVQRWEAFAGKKAERLPSPRAGQSPHTPAGETAATPRATAGGRKG